MIGLKEIISTVTYSEETSNFMRLNLIKYSELSFVIQSEYFNGKNNRNMTEEEKDLINESIDSIKKLGGKVGMNFTDKKNNKFFGYLFSISRGQKALDWFSEQTEKLPTVEEIDEKLDNSIKRVPELRNEYVNRYSYKSKEDLYEIMGATEQKEHKFYKKPPTFTLNAPTRAVLDNPVANKITIIPGLPTKKLPKKQLKQEDLENALRVVAEAIESGLITSDFKFNDLKLKDNVNYVTHVTTSGQSDTLNKMREAIPNVKLTTLSFFTGAKPQDDDEDSSDLE